MVNSKMRSLGSGDPTGNAIGQLMVDYFSIDESAMNANATIRSGLSGDTK
jgi:hypothetical protein